MEIVLYVFGPALAWCQFHPQQLWPHGTKNMQKVLNTCDITLRHRYLLSLAVWLRPKCYNSDAHSAANVLSIERQKLCLKVGFSTFLLKQEAWTSNPIQDIHLADKEAWKQPNITILHEDTLFT